MNKRNIVEDRETGFAKAAVYYLICQLLVRGMSFLTTPIFSRLMTKSEYGQVSNFLAWEGLLFPILTLDLRITINKSKYDHSEDNDSYLSSIVTASLLTTAIAWIIIEIFHDFFAKMLNMDIIHIRILLLYIFFYVSFDYQQLQLNIYRKYRTYVVYSLLISFFSLLLSVLLVYTLSDKYTGRVLGIVLPVIMLGFYILIQVYKRSHIIRVSYMLNGIKMSVPLILSTMSATILSSSDRIVITKYLGESQTAMYSIAYTVSSLSAIVWNAFNHALAPWMYDNLNHRKYEEIRSMTNKIVDGYSLVVGGLIVFAPSILWILGSEKYSGSIIAMPPVVLAMVCQFFYVFYFYIEYSKGETTIISVGTLIAAIVNIVLNIIYVPKYGYVAASYTTLIGYTVMLAYHYFIVRVRLKAAFIFDNKHFVLMGVALILLQIIAYHAYSNASLQLVLGVLYVMFAIGYLVKNRFFFKEFLKKVINRKK